jgi:hypothetical protein
MMSLHDEELRDLHRLKTAGMLKQEMRTNFSRQKCIWMTKEEVRRKLRNISCKDGRWMVLADGFV